MFIKQIDFQSDVEQILADLDSILQLCGGWPAGNQIGLNHRPGASEPWTDAEGSRYQKYQVDRERPLETDFSIWNSQVPKYLTEQVQGLQQHLGCGIGRARIMRLMPKTGLTVHFDQEPRLHLVLKTNPMSYIAHCVREARDDSQLPSASISYHMPANGHWYEVDTRQMHYVYNGGFDERIHLVLCKA